MAHLMWRLLVPLALLSALGDLVSCGSAPCDLAEAQYGFVCRCTAEYCDYLDDPTPDTEDELVVVTSSKAGLRFETTKGSFNNSNEIFVPDYHQQKEEKASTQKRATTRHVRLSIDRQREYQKIVGFGGAFTGAVAYLMQQLPQGLQDKIYESYYSPHGIAYNLLRIPIGGCDFDLNPWAFNELPENDLMLSNFTLDSREELRISQIKRLIEISGNTDLKIKGAAWSSPRWMKTNQKWTGISRLRKEYYQTWADYHLKWLELMEQNGLTIWAISTGNEPLNGVLMFLFVRFMSLGWTPRQQGTWIADYLGPTIRNSKFKDLILFGHDDQRHSLPTFISTMKSSSPNSLDFLNGVAVHWYFDEIVSPSLIDKAHSMIPDKIFLISESSIGDKPWQRAKPQMGSWRRGEKFARSILQDLQHHFNGWIDWNLILDENGGPNYVNNTVDAPIIVNMTNPNEVFKQPMFYVFGHFSKFIPENSRRIDVQRSNINIDSVAFLRPDGIISAVLFNSGNADVRVTITDSERGQIVIDVPSKSINTILYR